MGAQTEKIQDFLLTNVFSKKNKETTQSFYGSIDSIPESKRY